ncbi:MAG: RNA-directed DNA polymerase [Deltaproteobacteria bacterium]|nr:RNA-directed DNA polymerase [Deltaproteobacteria bacterium]
MTEPNQSTQNPTGSVGGGSSELSVRVPDWAAVVEAGGRDAFIERELLRLGLVDESTEPGKLSDSEKKAFKARREEERRVRRELDKATWASYRAAHILHLGAGVFYSEGIDIDRFDLDDPKARRDANGLPDIANAQALAKLLGISMFRLRQLTYHRDVDSGSNYIRWMIPKRSGGLRLISAPKKELKRIQRFVAKEIVEHLPMHGSSHGFVRGRSTRSNAIKHAKAEVIIKLDLSSFYPTITFPRVKGLFRKAGYQEKIATLLALLVTESPREERHVENRTYYVANGPRSLPQGAPTSPAITNTLCLRLDSRLDGLCAKWGLVYTRYADDLTFSAKKGSKVHVGKAIGAVKRIVSEEGFVVHPAKTRIMRGGRRQKVTGLVVNAAPGAPLARVPRKLVRRLRAAITNRERNKPLREGAETIEQLRGYAAYVAMTDPPKGKAFLDRINRLAEREPTAG